MNMKVLFLVRPDYYNTGITGDFVQINETKNALNKLGVDVTISTGFDVKGKWDIVHLWASSDWNVGYTYLRLKKINNKYPTVLSTIYWPWKVKGNSRLTILGKMISVSNRCFGPLPAGYLESMIGIIKGTNYAGLNNNALKYYYDNKHGYDKLRNYIFTQCNKLLPNSQSEKEIIERQYKIYDKFVIVPNAVNSDLFINAKKELFFAKHKIDNFILCAASIAPWKNQLNVVQALKDIDIPLVFIGGHDIKYIQECKRTARKAPTYYLEPLKQEELASAYKCAKVHVLASYRETPGLSSMEAAVAGCAIVSTNCGSAKDYFGTYAHYCEPDNLESIRNATIKALAIGGNVALKDKIIKEYTWEAAAKTTIEAYVQIVPNITNHSK